MDILEYHITTIDDCLKELDRALREAVLSSTRRGFVTEQTIQKVLFYTMLADHFEEVPFTKITMAWCEHSYIEGINSSKNFNGDEMPRAIIEKAMDILKYMKTVIESKMVKKKEVSQ